MVTPQKRRIVDIHTPLERICWHLGLTTIQRIILAIACRLRIKVIAKNRSVGGEQSTSGNFSFAHCAANYSKRDFFDERRFAKDQRRFH